MVILYVAQSCSDPLDSSPYSCLTAVAMMLCTNFKEKPEMDDDPEAPKYLDDKTLLK
jgi:hypothetical protein